MLLTILCLHGSGCTRNQTGPANLHGTVTLSGSLFCVFTWYHVDRNVLIIVRMRTLSVFTRYRAAHKNIIECRKMTSKCITQATLLTHPFLIT